MLYVLQIELMKRKLAAHPKFDWNIRTINSGLNCATTEALAKNLKHHVLFYKPSLVILIAGKNDALFDRTVIEHAKNIKEICSTIKKNNIDIIYASSTPTLKKSINEKYETYANAAFESLKKLNIPCIDMFNKYKQFDLKRLFTFRFEHGNKELQVKPGGIDPAHPNQLGNAYIAKILLKEIFGIEFDPEIYLKDTSAGKKKPRY